MPCAFLCAPPGRLLNGNASRESRSQVLYILHVFSRTCARATRTHKHTYSDGSPVAQKEEKMKPSCASTAMEKTALAEVLLVCVCVCEGSEHFQPLSRPHRNKLLRLLISLHSLQLSRFPLFSFLCFIASVRACVSPSPSVPLSVIHVHRSYFFSLLSFICVVVVRLVTLVFASFRFVLFLVSTFHGRSRELRHCIHMHALAMQHVGLSE